MKLVLSLCYVKARMLCHRLSEWIPGQTSFLRNRKYRIDSERPVRYVERRIRRKLRKTFRPAVQ